MMESSENSKLENEIFQKLEEAEREADTTDKRYSSREVLSAMHDTLEIEYRINQINAQPEEEQTAEEAASLAAADAMDDGTTVSLEEFKKALEN